MSEEVEAHIYKKFEIVQKLGKGAYGIVWKAIEKATKKTVALKKVFEAFHNATDAQRTYREVMILQELNGHTNVVKLLNVIKADNNKDLYLVFEFMETDLHAVIKAGILKGIHKQYIIYQLLKGLKYIHSGEIIHRDLKPSNILINSDCLIKLADFGLARSVDKAIEEGDPIMTEYVATRWYRAPEIVLGSNQYSKAVDVWSVGCILAELINGRALFPGKSTLNQIELILSVLGKPDSRDIKDIGSENAYSIINSIGGKQRMSFEKFFKDQNPVVIDFLRKCLYFNPKKRFTIDDALNHPYIAQFREKKTEKILNEPIHISIDDNKKLSIKEYREALYNNIIVKKKEQRKQWRQKYLKQLGIDVKGDELKKDQFKSILAKRKEKKKINSSKLSNKQQTITTTSKTRTGKFSSVGTFMGSRKSAKLRTSSNSLLKNKYTRKEGLSCKNTKFRSNTSKDKRFGSVKGNFGTKEYDHFGNALENSKSINYKKISSYYRNILENKNYKTHFK